MQKALLKPNCLWLNSELEFPEFIVISQIDLSDFSTVLVQRT